MDIIAISSAAYNGLKVAKEIFLGFNSLKNEALSIDKINEAVKKVGEAQNVIFQLREELFRLQEENDSLRKHKDEYEAWKESISKYRLVSTEGGAIVFESLDDPKHYICPSCVQSKEIHILQDSRDMAGTFDCTKCKATFPIKPKEKMKPIEYTSLW